MVGPLAEVGSAILVTKQTILGIGHQPLLGLFKEFLKQLRGECLLSLLCKEQFQVFCLGVIDTLIVYLRKSIEFLTQRLKMRALLFVGDGGQ